MLHMQSDLASSAMQRQYWNRYWCCSRPEQCRFGPVSEHFFCSGAGPCEAFSLHI